MIERDDIDGIAVVRLAHGKVNALDIDLLDAITETFTELNAGPARAVVFTGAAGPSPPAWISGASSTAGRSTFTPSCRRSPVPS